MDPLSFRGGLELWGKLLAPGLRGSTFLLNAGVEAQYFYQLDKVALIGQLGVRLGWPSFGTLPASFLIRTGRASRSASWSTWCTSPRSSAKPACATSSWTA